MRAQMLFNFFRLLCWKKTIYKYFACLYKILLSNFEKCTKCSIRIYVRLSWFGIGFFFIRCVSPLTGWRKNPPRWTCYDRFTEKLQNYNNRVYGQVSALCKRLSINAVTSSLKRGPEKYRRKTKLLYLIFLTKNDFKQLKNQQRTIRKCWFNFKLLILRKILI